MVAGLEVLARLALVIADTHRGDGGRIDPDRSACLADDPEPAGAQGNGGALALHALAPHRARAGGVEAGFAGAQRLIFLSPLDQGERNMKGRLRKRFTVRRR